MDQDLDDQPEIKELFDICDDDMLLLTKKQATAVDALADASDFRTGGQATNLVCSFKPE
jgi:hypothetical protein